MVDWNGKRSIGSVTFDTKIFSKLRETNEVLLDAATAGYVPAVGDVLCYKTDDSNKHQEYIETDKAALVIMGIISELESDNTGTPVVKITYAVDASVWYAGILGGTTGVDNAAKKLVLKEALRAKNINLND